MPYMRILKVCLQEAAWLTERGRRSAAPGALTEPQVQYESAGFW